MLVSFHVNWSKNIVYLTSCLHCGAQYVGQTCRTLKERMSQVCSQGNTFNKQIRKNQPHTSQSSCPRLIAHFFHPASKCNWSKHARVQPIELAQNFDTVKATNENRLLRETFWIRTLRTVYPYGLNAKSKDGEENENKKTPKLSVEKIFNPIQRKRLRIRGSKKVKKGEAATMDAPETLYSKFTEAMYDPDPELLLWGYESKQTPWRSQLRMTLNTYKRSALMEVNEWMIHKDQSEILDTDLGQCIMDLLKTRLGKKLHLSKPEKKPKPDFIWKLLFCNPGMDFLNLPRLLRDPALIATLPNQDADEKKNKRPTIVFTQTKPLRNRIFNYTKTLNDLNPEVWNNIDSHTPCCCNTGTFSQFVDKAHDHVITGNLDIVSNTTLREMLKLGPKFRDRVPLDWNEVKTEVLESLDSLTHDWANELKADLAEFNEWKVCFRNLLQARLEMLQIKFINPPRHTLFRLLPPFLSQPSVCNALKTLHENFVLVPADKAEGNVIVVCKRFYIQQVIKELQPDEQEDIKTFVQVNKHNDDNIDIATEVITNIEGKMKELNIPTVGEWSKLASFYWTAKMHKTPVGSRFITASNRCVIKPVSQVLTHCFRKVQKALRDMHTTDGTKNHIWITDNAAEPRRKLKYFSIRKAAKCVSTYDFSTLYTKIEHKKLVEAMSAILKSVFQYMKKKNGQTQNLKINLENLNSKKRHRWVHRSGQNGKTKKGKYLSLDCQDVIMLFKFLLENCYILVGDKVFRQRIGIPMGTDCSPFIANLFLYYFENIRMDEMKASVQKKHQDRIGKLMHRYVSLH